MVEVFAVFKTHFFYFYEQPHSYLHVKDISIGSECKQSPKPYSSLLKVVIITNLGQRKKSA